VFSASLAVPLSDYVLRSTQGRVVLALIAAWLAASMRCSWEAERPWPQKLC
jgi:hypothetical protein